MTAQHWHLFAVHGVEIEYMIVDQETLQVLPWADRVLVDAQGQVSGELDFGPISWCNELARHVLELKCTRPAEQLAPLVQQFQDNIQQVNQRLAPLGAQLLPGGMHPWMDPVKELALWPMENTEIYQAYDRIFSCQGHGWANLQSVQLNLPFANDAEFGQLHAAIRAVIPLLCGLAASTPYAEGQYTGMLDYRMEVYRHNSKRIPLVAGDVVPEPVFSIADYHDRILRPMYASIAPWDAEGVLQEDWLNSRGGLPRFERQSIEVRTIDSQECVSADIALMMVVTALIRALVEERWVSQQQLRAVPQAVLQELFLTSIQRAEHSWLDDSHWFNLFALPRRGMSLGLAWGSIIERLQREDLLPTAAEPMLQHILSHGTLASRILAQVGTGASRDQLKQCYQSLSTCLSENRQF